MNAESDVDGVGAIVLAGASHRPLHEAPPVGHAPAERVRQGARAAVEAGLWPVVVVLGPGSDLVRSALAGLPVVTCTSAGEAAGGAVRQGLARLAECAPGARALVLLRCDEPATSAAHLRALAAAARREGKPIAATAFDGAVGSPALFAALLFPALARAADGDALPLLAADPTRVAIVDIEMDERI